MARTPSQPTRRNKPSSWDALLQLLRVRPRTEGEARQRLAKRGFDRAEIEDTIQRAKTVGIIDDRLFVRLWVGDRMASKPLSRKAMETELCYRGVDGALVRRLLADEYPQADERAIAERVAAERFRRLHDRPMEVRSRRTLDLLLRRGFRRGLAIEIVRGLERTDDGA